MRRLLYQLILVQCFYTFHVPIDKADPIWLCTFWFCHLNYQVYNLQEHEKTQVVIHSGPCCPLYLQELDSSLETLTTAFEKATSEKLRFQDDVNRTNKTIELANRLVKGLEVSNKIETGLNVNKVVFRHLALL